MPEEGNYPLCSNGPVPSSTSRIKWVIEAVLPHAVLVGGTVFFGVTAILSSSPSKAAASALAAASCAIGEVALIYSQCK